MTCSRLDRLLQPQSRKKVYRQSKGGKSLWPCPTVAAPLPIGLQWAKQRPTTVKRSKPRHERRPKTSSSLVDLSLRRRRDHRAVLLFPLHPFGRGDRPGQRGIPCPASRASSANPCWMVVHPRGYGFHSRGVELGCGDCRCWEVPGPADHYLYCLVVAAVECMLVPFGTVLGVLTIIVLNRPSVKALVPVRR